MSKQIEKIEINNANIEDKKIIPIPISIYLNTIDFIKKRIINIDNLVYINLNLNERKYIKDKILTKYK